MKRPETEGTLAKKAPVQQPGIPEREEWRRQTPDSDEYLSAADRAREKFIAARERAREQLQRPKDSFFRRIAIIISHRLLLTLLLMALQIAVVAFSILVGTQSFVRFYFICIGVSLLAVVYIVNKQSHPDYKIGWIVPILTFPLFGGMFYLLFGGNSPTKRSLKRMEALENLSSSLLSGPEPVFEELMGARPAAANQSRYIYNTSGCPPYGYTKTEYLSSGERYYQRLLEELEKAEHYIFLQYFIIDEGILWDSILEILIRKASKGVDVRVIYDDVGSMMTLPRGYAKQLRRWGIECAVFNPFVPVVSLRLNNRDHRKICVIDGHTGFTGGMNLADEYANFRTRFGHWKDSGILLHGEAVWSLTAVFLACWDYTTGMEETLDAYRPRYFHPPAFENDGVVQPYTSNPGSESVGVGVYMHLINRARRYLYITTPYLVIDDAMTRALCDAALSGVDVRIITPHVPDKRYVFELTRAHYVPLLEAGVKIYEYTPGFIHAKNFAVDDEYGVVGTVNLDYRSLYLHYEDGVWMFGSRAVAEIRDDFLATLGECEQVELEQATSLGWFKRLYRSLLRLLAPLM